MVPPQNTNVANGAVMSTRSRLHFAYGTQEHQLLCGHLLRAQSRLVIVRIRWKMSFFWYSLASYISCSYPPRPRQADVSSNVRVGFCYKIRIQEFLELTNYSRKLKQ